MPLKAQPMPTNFPSGWLLDSRDSHSKNGKWNPTINQKKVEVGTKELPKGAGNEMAGKQGKDLPSHQTNPDPDDCWLARKTWKKARKKASRIPQKATTTHHQPLPLIFECINGFWITTWGLERERKVRKMLSWSHRMTENNNLPFQTQKHAKHNGNGRKIE